MLAHQRIEPLAGRHELLALQRLGHLFEVSGDCLAAAELDFLGAAARAGIIQFDRHETSQIVNRTSSVCEPSSNRTRRLRVWTAAASVAGQALGAAAANSRSLISRPMLLSG